jgi:uncharacterized protein YdgA (DUF945 family)
MNKKNLAIGLASFAGLFAALPFGVGIMVEKQMRAQIEQAKEAVGLPFWMSIDLENYRRGWLSASADTVLTADFSHLASQAQAMKIPAQLMSHPIRIVFHHDIHHGAVIIEPALRFAAATMDTRLTVPPELAAVARHYFKDQAPLSYSTVVSLLGDSEVHAVIPAYSGPGYGGSFTVEWRGFDAVAHGKWFELGGSGKGTAPLLKIVAGDNEFSAKATALDFNAKITDMGLMVGNTALRVGELSGSMPAPGGEQKKFALQGLNISAASSLTGELMNVEESLGFGKAAAGDFDAGPGLLQMKVNNMDAQSLAKLGQEMNAFERSSFNPAESNRLMTEKLFPLITAILKKSPSFEIAKAHLVTQDGALDGRVKVAFDGREDFDIHNAASIIRNLTVDGEIEIPVLLSNKLVRGVAAMRPPVTSTADGSRLTPEDEQRGADQASEAMIAGMEQAKIIVRDGERHKIQFQFRDGKFSVNGQPADNLGAMLGAARASGTQ